MQVGRARHARHIKRMRSLLQKARSHAVVDGKETSVPRGALCPVYALCTGKIMGGSSWRTHCAGMRERDFTARPCRGATEGLLWNFSRGTL